jgi:hypothetical protein
MQPRLFADTIIAFCRPSQCKNPEMVSLSSGFGGSSFFRVRFYGFRCLTMEKSAKKGMV